MLLFKVSKIQQNKKDMMKKISIIKPNIAVDILPHAIFLTKDNIQDRKRSLSMFYLYHNNFNSIRNVIANGGYSGEKFANSKILYSPVKIFRKNTLHTFSVISKR